MEKALTAAAALSVAIASVASAQTPLPPPDAGRFGPPPPQSAPYRSEPRWSRGDRLPPQYRPPSAYITDWNRRGLRRPPKGARWVRHNDHNYFLVIIATGLILETVYRDEGDQNWQRRYSQRYTYQDDLYYRECRDRPDPAGVLVGALIGGLIGKAVGGDDHGDGAAIAGVILGGVVGAQLSRDLDCEDRSYAYRSYYDGFNSGRPGSRHTWRNPRSGHYGDVRIGDYYRDPAGFRCTTFTQTVYIGGRPRMAEGRACRQPDGSWAVVN